MKRDRTIRPPRRPLLPLLTLVVVIVLAAWLGIALWTPPPDTNTSAPALAYQAPPPIAREPARSAPRPTFPDVRLLLSGIARRGNNAVALIGVENREPQYYAAGEPVTGGIVVRTVFPDRVVLGYGNLSKTLYLKSRRTETAGQTISNRPSDPEDDDDGYKEKNPNIDPAALTLKRIAAAKEFLRDVVLAPDPRGGFVVKEVTPGSVYQTMGLREGDVLYSIDTPANRDIDESSMESMIRQVELQLEVYRNGNFVLLKRALN